MCVTGWRATRARGLAPAPVRQFDTFAEAGERLVLSDTEIAAVARGEGFAQIVGFDIGAQGGVRAL